MAEQTAAQRRQRLEIKINDARHSLGRAARRANRGVEGAADEVMKQKRILAERRQELENLNE